MSYLEKIFKILTHLGERFIRNDSNKQFILAVEEYNTTFHPRITLFWIVEHF